MTGAITNLMRRHWYLQQAPAGERSFATLGKPRRSKIPGKRVLFFKRQDHRHHAREGNCAKWVTARQWQDDAEYNHSARDESGPKTGIRLGPKAASANNNGMIVA